MLQQSGQKGGGEGIGGVACRKAADKNSDSNYALNQTALGICCVHVSLEGRGKEGGRDLRRGRWER